MTNTNEPCACYLRHQPPHFNVEGHHVLPQSWGGQVLDPTKPGFTRLVSLCATSHNNEHLVLNQFVHLDRPPTTKELAAVFTAISPKYRTFLLILANEAWNHPDRPQAPGYTLAHTP